MATSSSELKQGIRKVALQGLINRDGGLIGTERILGYVCAIHPDDEEDLGGTIDVQEYNCDGKEDGEGYGLHEGVKLSAIQNNKAGYRIIPQLYSDVIIIQDPNSMEEYVILYSHAQAIQMNAWEKVEIGVTEHEEFKESDDGLEKDYYELEEKENKSYSQYDKENLKHGVESKNSKSLMEMTAAKSKTSVAGDDTSYCELTASQAVINVAGKSTITVTGDKIEIVTGSTNVKLDGSNVEVNGSLVKVNGSDTEAVRYKELSQFLQKLCQNISTGNCVNGSPLSTAPAIGAMASEIPNFQSQKVKLS